MVKLSMTNIFWRLWHCGITAAWRNAPLRNVAHLDLHPPIEMPPPHFEQEEPCGFDPREPSCWKVLEKCFDDL